MHPITRFLQDILGYFMEKVSPAMKVVILGGISAAIIYFGSFQIFLNVVSVVLWCISLFMFGLLIYRLIKDRNKA